MINAYKICIGVLLLLPFNNIRVCAQNVNQQQVLQVFEKIRQVYSDPVPVQFRVKYVYANESTPSKILDSSNGYMELGSHGYYCRMDSTETIQTDSLAILLFNEDRIMYLSKKGISKGLSANPVAMLDTFFQKIPGLKVSVKINGSNKNITLGFPPGLPYKRLEFVMDTVTSFIQQVTYTVKTEKLMEDQNSGFDKTAYDEYAIITADFFDYKKGMTNIKKLETANYFIKDKDGIKTTDKYKDYKIFMASPNL